MKPRTILIISGFVGAGAAIASAYADSLALLFVTYGGLLGVSIGASYTASLVSLGGRFEKGRPLALGLSYLGSHLGGFILSPLFAWTLEELSLTGTMWIFAGIMLQMIVAGMFTMTQ